MTLSEDEQERLDGIETSLLAEDPGFARTLDLVAGKRVLQQRIRIADYGFWVGLAVTIIGAAAAQGALSIGTLISCYGLGLLVWSLVTLFRCRGALPDSLSLRAKRRGAP